MTQTDPILAFSATATRPGGGPGDGRPVAVFDLDGTLVDTAPDLAASLDHCLGLRGLPPSDHEAMRPHAGRGARVMLETALEACGKRLAPTEMEEEVVRFVAYYRDHIAVASTPFPGALAALDRLEADGFALAVCTNKLEELARLLLETLGLAGRFAAICGADTFGVRKPDPAHLRGTIERAGGQLERAVMIGDSVADVEAARAAGVPVVVMAFGYDAAEAADHGPDTILPDFDALGPATLRNMIARVPIDG